MDHVLQVKPAPGLVVRDPATRQPLPADGGEVPDTTFWRRRLADGDVQPSTAATTRTTTKSRSAQ